MILSKKIPFTFTKCKKSLKIIASSARSAISTQSLTNVQQRHFARFTINNQIYDKTTDNVQKNEQRAIVLRTVWNQ